VANFPAGTNQGGFSIATAQSRIQKLHIMNITNKSSWSNPGTMPVDLTFYSIVVRRSNGFQDPRDAWAIGEQEEGNTNAITPVAPQVGAATAFRATPHRSKAFTRHFWVKDVKRVTLAPGEIHRRTVIWSKPRAVDLEFFTTFTTSAGGPNPTFTDTYHDGIEGYTCYQLVVVNGYPAPLNTGDAVTPVASTTDATIAPAAVVYAWNEKVSYKFTTPTAKHMTVNNTLNTTTNVVVETELVLKQDRSE
jgi:hypothetical protein